MQIHIPFFWQINTSPWLGGKSGDMALILTVPWKKRNSRRLRQPLCVALKFRLWLSRADSVLTPTMNIRLPLFWSTLSWGLCPDSAAWFGRCAGGWHMGRDYSYCIASEHFASEGLAIFFLDQQFWKSKGQPWDNMISNPHRAHPPGWGQVQGWQATALNVLCRIVLFLFLAACLTHISRLQIEVQKLTLCECNLICFLIAKLGRSMGNNETRFYPYRASNHGQ